MNKQELVKSVHEEKQKFFSAFAKGSLHYIEAGRSMLNLKVLKPWKHDGSEAHGWREWVTKELNIKFWTAKRIMDVTASFGEALLANPEYLTIEQSKLLMLSRNKLLQNEWLDKAKVLTISALEDEIREKTGGQPKDTCQHDNGKILIEKCKKCGGTVNVTKTD